MVSIVVSRPSKPWPCATAGAPPLAPSSLRCTTCRWAASPSEVAPCAASPLGRAAVMHAHAAEVGAERALHLLPRRRRQLRARAGPGERGARIGGAGGPGGAGGRVGLAQHVVDGALAGSARRQRGRGGEVT